LKLTNLANTIKRCTNILWKVWNGVWT